MEGCALACMGPQAGLIAAASLRLAMRLAASSRGPEASPLAHQSVHSPSRSGILAPKSRSNDWTASVAVVKRRAGFSPSLFHASMKSESGVKGGSLS